MPRTAVCEDVAEPAGVGIEVDRHRERIDEDQSEPTDDWR